MNDSTRENIQSLAQADLIDFTDSFSDESRAANSEKFIVFYLNDKLFAVSAKQVVEVIQPMPVTPLPKVPEWLSGIVNVRGRIISVINFSKLWGAHQKSPAASKSKLILLHSAKRETNFAFAVDRLNEIAVLSVEQIETSDLPEMSYLLGKIPYKSENLYLLDAEKICQSLENGH